MLCFCSQCRLWLTDAAGSLAWPRASRSAEPGEGARQCSARRAGGSGPHGARESQELSVSRSPVKMEQVAHGSGLCRRWESHAGVAVGRRPKDSAHFEWGGGPHPGRTPPRRQGERGVLQRSPQGPESAVGVACGGAAPAADTPAAPVLPQPLDTAEPQTAPRSVLP